MPAPGLRELRHVRHAYSTRGRSQQSVRTALVDPDSRLRRQVVAAPADAVVFQRAAHAVVGHGAVLQADAAACAEAHGEERAELRGAAVVVVRADGLAEVPVGREGAHYRFRVTSVQRGLVAAHDVSGAGEPGLEDGRPEVAPSVDRPLAAVGAEHHRRVVDGFGDDRHRPGQFPPVAFPPVAGQVRQQFDHGPPADDGGGHGLDTGMALGQPGLILADEPPQLLVAADLARAGIIDHHLARPRSLQKVGVTFVQRGEVLRNRISPTCGTSLPARQLHGTGELRKPRHLNPHAPVLCRPPLAVLPVIYSSPALTNESPRHRIGVNTLAVTQRGIRPSADRAPLRSQLAAAQAQDRLGRFV